MNRAHQHPPDSGEGAMNSSQENRTMRSWTAGSALVLALGLSLPMAAWAEPKITSVTGAQQGGTDVVRVELSGPLASVPAGFVVQAPPRVAIDLPGVTNSSGKSNIEVNQGNVRSVSVASSGDRTRLVLNLKVPSSYHAEIQGKTLLISLDTGGAPVATTTTTTSTSTQTHFPTNTNPPAPDSRD